MESDEEQAKTFHIDTTTTGKPPEDDLLPQRISCDTGEVIAGRLVEIDNVRQGLRQRHIQMIALAGAVGTGLFLGSGRAIAAAGPLGVFLGYAIVGALVAPVVLAVGEMGTLVPLNGGIVRYSELFVDPALSFANGWNLVYSYLVSILAEIVAAAVLIEFWITVNNAIWITVFSALMLLCANLSDTRIRRGRICILHTQDHVDYWGKYHGFGDHLRRWAKSQGDRFSIDVVPACRSVSRDARIFHFVSILLLIPHLN